MSRANAIRDRLVELAGRADVGAKDIARHQARADAAYALYRVLELQGDRARAGYEYGVYEACHIALNARQRSLHEQTSAARDEELELLFELASLSY